MHHHGSDLSLHGEALQKNIFRIGSNYHPNLNLIYVVMGLRNMLIHNYDNDAHTCTCTRIHVIIVDTPSPTALHVQNTLGCIDIELYYI